MLVAYIFATIASVYKVFVSPQLHFGDSWTLFSLTQEASCLHFCNNCKCIQSIRLTSTAFWGFSDPLFCKTSSTHLTCQLQNCKCTKYTRSTHPSGRASLYLLWSVGEANKSAMESYWSRKPKGCKNEEGNFLEGTVVKCVQFNRRPRTAPDCNLSHLSETTRAPP